MDVPSTFVGNESFIIFTSRSSTPHAGEASAAAKTKIRKVFFMSLIIKPRIFPVDKNSRRVRIPHSPNTNIRMLQ